MKNLLNKKRELTLTLKTYTGQCKLTPLTSAHIILELILLKINDFSTDYCKSNLGAFKRLKLQILHVYLGKVPKTSHGGCQKKGEQFHPK
mgnify:CR=1 FL=1